MKRSIAQDFQSRLKEHLHFKNAAKEDVHQRFGYYETLKVQKLLSQDIFGSGKEVQRSSAPDQSTEAGLGVDATRDVISETQSGVLSASTTNQMRQMDFRNLQSAKKNAARAEADSEN